MPMILSLISMFGLAALGGAIAADTSVLIAVAVAALVVAAVANAIGMLQEILGALRR